ncbi:MAG: hypothetical protein J6X69_01425 [Bacteroidales bacterium]|nr:hypothetical protein [Bacteroidales bacterium]
MGILKEYLRKRQLNRHSYKGKTALRAIEGLRSATVLLDVSQTPHLLEFRDNLHDWFFRKGIRVRFFYLDFRKPGKNLLQLSTPAETIFLKNLSWFTQTPDLAGSNPDFLKPCDLFVSFVSTESYPLRFLSAAIPSSFKIGAVSDASYPYDLMIPASNPDEMFACLKDILSKIS